MSIGSKIEVLDKFISNEINENKFVEVSELYLNELRSLWKEQRK